MTPVSAELVSALRDHRPALARALYEPLVGWEKFAGEIEAARAGEHGGVARYLELHYFVFVDCLALYLEKRDRTFRDLYLGEMVILLTWKGDADQAELREARWRRMLQAGARGMIEILGPRLSAEALALLTTELAELERILTARARASLSILMIGDCLNRDVMAFLTAAAVEDGISVSPTFLTTKNPAELRNELGALRERSFDLVFFSPFTYEFSPSYAQTLNLRNVVASPARLRALVDPAFEQASQTLGLLAELFECPIVVHNSVNVRRHDGSVQERLKNAATLLTRRRARKIVNPRLAARVAEINASSFEHVFVLDELKLLAHASETQLGRTLYDSDAQHPAELGRWIAREYRDYLFARAYLLSKKVLVCDLDNTLWEGVIGEGAVKHHLGHQRRALALKDKGVVLAILSKNDPKNVHWRGGALKAEDFVSTQISWESKRVGLKRITQELNLKAKDFVFIDDRADERAMIASEFKGLEALDPLDGRSWALLDRWAELAPKADEDRTAFYKQRETRQEFLDSGSQEDPTAMFDQLELQVTVREAARGDLKRVAELVNRTNQFNTCGARTTLKEVTAFHESSDHRIWVIDARDKFGSMGTISVAVVRDSGDRLEIPIFVLSCRVFGYRIEDVILNAVKRRADGRRVVGAFKETPHNEPCRKVYPANGFEWDGTAWVFGAEAPTGLRFEDPRWLAVHDRTAQLVD